MEVEPTRLTYRGLGYGTDPGGALLDYRLIVSNEELQAMLTESFDEFVRQCKQDDDLFSDSDIPELKAMGYPSLAKMLLSHRAMLVRLLRDFLYFHLLEALTGNNTQAEWLFAINLITDVIDEQQGFALVGVGYFLGEVSNG